MLNSVTLLGSSSGRNAGDAALMSGIMDSVDAACGERLLYEIPTIKPAFVRDNYKNNVRAVGMLPWNLSIKMLGVPTYRSVMRTDLSVIFDAILFDRALYNPLFNFLSTLHLLLPRAKKQGKKLAFYNVGTGPVHTKTGKRMLREISELMDFITVRDQDSYDILKEIGVQNPRIIQTADAALNLKPASAGRIDQILKDLGLDRSKEFLALNINAYLDTWANPKGSSMGRERFLASYAEAVNRIANDIGVPILLVITQHHDLEITKELISRLKTSQPVTYISNIDYSHYEIQGVLGRAALLFAMRLHAMILASSQLTPIAGLAYQPKIDHYFRTLGLPELSIGFENFSADTLVRHILGAWEKKMAIRNRLSLRIPVLKEEAEKAAHLVAAIRRGEDLDAAISRLGSTSKAEAQG